MNVSAPFIRRPVATTLLTAAVALAGAASFGVLPVSPLPKVDFPTISVSASLPGASADIMGSSVATPLERQFGHIAGVSEMTSASTLGNTAITLQFDLGRDIDGAARDVEAAINAARTYLPANLPANPTYRKVNPSDAPILILGLTSDKFDSAKLYDVASTVIQQKLSQIQGVGQVIIGGGTLPAVRVDVDPTRLAAYGLTLAGLQSTLSLQNADLAKGRVSGATAIADILANDQISRADEYKPLVVGTSGGAAVRLSDVAQVTDSVQNLRAAGYLNGKPSITVIIFRQPGANIIATVDRIRAQLPFIQASIPGGIDTTVVLDRTTTIRASVGDVERTLALSVVLVVAVVFLFLGDARATLIPGVAVPVSLLGTCAVMYLLGYSIDNLSLMALTISTGFVVDDAIVVMENIERHLEGGLKPFAAALKGAEEIGFTVFSISVSLIAVFIPLLLMGGIVGRLFREFAVTLSTAIAVSMAVSLTATPMMCAHLLRAPRADGRKRGEALGRVLASYRRSLRWVLDNPASALAALFLAIAFNVVLILKIPKGFFPQQDTGALAGALQGPQDASFPSMDDAIRRIVDVVKGDPAVANVIAFTGNSGAANTGVFYVALKPLSERRIGAAAIIDRLRPRLRLLPVGSAFLQAVQDLRIGGRASNAMYQYTLQSDDIKDLSKWGPVVLREMKRLPGLQDVSSDQQDGGLEELMTYDRLTAARLGVTAQALDAALYAAFGQSEVSIIYTQMNQYYVVLEVAPRFWRDPSGLKALYLRSPGGSVPLGAMAEGRSGTTPLSVNHTGLFPSVTVSFNLASNVALSQATQSIERMQERLGIPSTMRGFFAGTLLAYQQSLGTEPALILTALLAVYIVLGILYESLVHPLTIISTLPSASVGAMLALIFFGEDLNVISIIGIVLLIGIVKKNAIMMIDFALQVQRQEGKGTDEAILEACVLRFRPIMMTTLAALLGALPLALGTGTGSELRRPLGIAIVGGLLLSQLLTLYTTPVVYLAFDRLRLRLRGKRAGRAASAAALAMLTSGCVVGPKYRPPESSALAPAYKESPDRSRDAGGWQVARPQDAQLRGKWWEIFGDPELNALEERLDIDNQSIKQSFENFMAARALVREARAQYFPTVGVGASLTYGRTSANLPGAAAGAAAAAGSSAYASSLQGTIYSLPLEASWEPDLWGKVRNTVRQAQYAAQVGAADLENERLSEQAALAQYFFELRGQDRLQKIFDDTVAADQKSLDLTRGLYETGIDNQVAVAEAETTLRGAQAGATNVGLARAQYEHAIATLVGQAASGFSLPVKPLAAAPPPIPVGVPSELLQRRPDIAAAERAMAAANAAIGVADAAYYPTLTLSAAAGFESDAPGNWLTWPSRFWSLGPSVSETIFDAGLRRAAVQQYTAVFNADLASYRQTVLTAFQQVEDSLAGVRILSKEAAQEQQAVDSARSFLSLEQARYETGLDPYIDVLVARTTLLADEQTLNELQVEEMTSAVALVEALGGGWERARLPTPEEVTRKPAKGE